MSLIDALPEHEPPRVSPSWRPLVDVPCRRCTGTRTYLQHLVQSSAPETHFPLVAGEAPDPEMIDTTATATVLCGDCGDVDERRGWIPTIDAAPAVYRSDE